MKTTSSSCWPPLPSARENDSQMEFKKLLYQAQLQHSIAQQADTLGAHKAKFTYYSAQAQMIYNAYIDVAKGQSEHAQRRAEFIQKASSTIGGVYGAILGLVFNAGKSLPLLGLVPAIFLGLSIVFTATYVTYLIPIPDELDLTLAEPNLKRSNGPKQSQNGPMMKALSTFIEWTRDLAPNRVEWLHSAIISLGLGVISLPVAFLRIPNELMGIQKDIVIGVCLVITVIILILYGLRKDLLGMTKK